MKLRASPAGKASHNASNARGVTAGKMGCNSSLDNKTSMQSQSHDECC